jgi:hypothetical protein
VVRADSLTGEAVTRIPPCEYSFLEPWTVDCRHVAYADCQAAQPGIDEIEFTVKDASLYSCGFDPPLSDPAVRAWPLPAILPMSMYIHDADTMLVTGADILPPVVTVAFADEAGGERSDVTHLTSAAGQATTGTHFHYDAGRSRWVLTLDTTALTRPGRYTVSVVAGGTNYLLEPGCSVQLTRE